MKLKLFLLATLLAVASCSNHEDEIEVEISQPEEIKPNKISWNFPTLTVSSSDNDPNYIFEYDSQGRVVKKIGGIVGVPGSVGLPSYISNSIYTSISYTGNSAIIANYSSSPLLNVNPNKRSIQFDNQGRIVTSIIYSPLYIEWEKHLTYHYDSTGKLIEILTQLPNMPYIATDPNDYILTYIEKFTYDTSGNLQKAVTTEKHNNVDALVLKEVEFSNFDTAQNPFKSLVLFDDYFYFSLSKNNPQKRIIRAFQSGNGFSVNELKWNNQYNSNGNLKLYY